MWGTWGEAAVLVRHLVFQQSTCALSADRVHHVDLQKAYNTWPKLNTCTATRRGPPQGFQEPLTTTTPHWSPGSSAGSHIASFLPRGVSQGSFLGRRDHWKSDVLRGNIMDQATYGSWYIVQVLQRHLQTWSVDQNYRIQNLNHFYTGLHPSDRSPTGVILQFKGNFLVFNLHWLMHHLHRIVGTSGALRMWRTLGHSSIHWSSTA